MTTEELKRLLESMSRLPWSRRWMSGAIRHVVRNVDEDAFYDSDGDPDADASGEINSPCRTDGAAMAEALNALPALLERVEGLEEALVHAQRCASCAQGPWTDCEEGRAALALLAKPAALTTEKEMP